MSAAQGADAAPRQRPKKYFVPLENNPEVMSSLAYKLGLSPALAFHDVYSIDEPELLAMLPRPALALLLVFPCNETADKFQDKEDSTREVYSGSGDGEPVVWFKQIIGNACGLYGLLHALSNGAAREHLDEKSTLANILREAIPLKPAERANVLYDSKALESEHSSAAQTGDTTAPAAEAVTEHHYVCFVKDANNHLWELDGGRKGPVDLGVLDAEDDVLSPAAIDAGVRRYLKREPEAGGEQLGFSLVALGPSLD